MPQIIIATGEEMGLLSPSQERIYRRFRLEGQTFEEIAKDLRMTKDNVKKKWREAIRMIERHRNLTENPQYFLHRGRDVLRGERGYGQVAAQARHLHTIPDLPAELASPEDLPLFAPGMLVRIRKNLPYGDPGSAFEELATAGLTATVMAVYDADDPPTCLIEFTIDTVEMQAQVTFEYLDPIV
ncbi:hypothetical protein KW797_02835 [Candidatus Parcubacteria bacterium]|nr:hypothetical protein [Candidatus Parcubacteria bacterium]